MNNEIMEAINKAIMDAIESKFHYIGSVLDKDARKKIDEEKIIDNRDFREGSSYVVEREKDSITMQLINDAPHAPFVLGGKVPSWTPLKPLMEWVERKKLSWVDKDNEALSVKQMAYMIRGKIKREGIPARNVYQSVIDTRESWIDEQINSIEVYV